MRKAATIVRAYMFSLQLGGHQTGAGEGSGVHSVRDDEATFRAMEAERDRLTRVVFGIEPGDDALAPSEASAKLAKVTAQFDTAKAKLIASLSQQIMDVTREVLETTSSSDAGKPATAPSPAGLPYCSPSASATPAVSGSTPWLASLFPSMCFEKDIIDGPVTPAGRASIASPTSRASARLSRIQL